MKILKFLETKTAFLLGILIPTGILFYFPVLLDRSPWVVLSVFLALVPVLIQVLIKLNELLEIEYLTTSEMWRLSEIVKAKKQRMIALVLVALVLFVACVILFMSSKLTASFSYLIGAAIGFAISSLAYFLFAFDEVSAFKATIIKRANESLKRQQTLNKLKSEG